MLGNNCYSIFNENIKKYFICILYFFEGKEMVDFIVEYLKFIWIRRVFLDVFFGYMCMFVLEVVLQEGEKWDDIFRDIECVIMFGVRQFELYFK